MKKIFLSIVSVALGTFAMAQQNKQMHRMDVAKIEQKSADQLKQMQTELNLSEAQITKIKVLQDKRIAERKENAPNIQAERKAKMEQIKIKRDQNQAEMKNILTPEQYQKWETIKDAKMQQRRKMIKERQMIQMQTR